MKLRLILLCSCCFYPGCGIFDYPVALARDLLPLAVQYAPYLLMFLEEPTEVNVADKSDINDFRLYLKQKLEQNPAEFAKLPGNLNEIFAAKSNGKYYLIRVSNAEEIKASQALFQQLSAAGKINYKIYNVPNDKLQSIEEEFTKEKRTLCTLKSDKIR